MFCWTGIWYKVHPLMGHLKSWLLPPWLRGDHFLHHHAGQGQSTRADESAVSTPHKHSPLHSHLQSRNVQNIKTNQQWAGWNDRLCALEGVSLFHAETLIEFTGQEIDNLNNTPRWSIALTIPRLIQLMNCTENRERHLAKLSTRSRAIWSDAFWVLLQSEKKINSGKNWAVITSIGNSLLNWENKTMQPLVPIEVCLLTVLTLSQISEMW